MSSISHKGSNTKKRGRTSEDSGKKKRPHTSLAAYAGLDEDEIAAICEMEPDIIDAAIASDAMTSGIGLYSHISLSAP